MNTGLLSWRRVLIVAQTLCLIAVGAIFLVSPFVALAGCGNKGGNANAVKVNVNKSIQLVGTIRQIDKNAPAGTQAFNAALALPGTPAGAITINKNFTLKDLKAGTWITGLRNGVPFQGTIFQVSKVNGNQNVAEVWLADVPQNSKNVKAGQVVKNVLLPASIPAA